MNRYEELNTSLQFEILTELQKGNEQPPAELTKAEKRQQAYKELRGSSIKQQQANKLEEQLTDHFKKNRK